MLKTIRVFLFALAAILVACSPSTPIHTEPPNAAPAETTGTTTTPNVTPTAALVTPNFVPIAIYAPLTFTPTPIPSPTIPRTRSPSPTPIIFNGPWATYRDDAMGIAFEYPALFDTDPIYAHCKPQVTNGELHFGAAARLSIAPANGLTLKQFATRNPEVRDINLDIESDNVQARNTTGISIAVSEYRGDYFATFFKSGDYIYTLHTLANYSLWRGCEKSVVGLTHVDPYRHAQTSLEFTKTADEAAIVLPTPTATKPPPTPSPTLNTTAAALFQATVSAYQTAHPPTPTCATTSHLKLSATQTTARVNEVIIVRVALENTGCATIHDPVFSFYDQAELGHDVFVFNNGMAYIHHISVAPNQSDIIEFNLRAAKVGQVTFTGAVGFNASQGTDFPYRWEWIRPMARWSSQ